MKPQKTIVTHNHSFHTDDVFAVATLLLAYPDQSFNIIRSRDTDVIAKADIVVDVGGIHDPSKRRFDHHQTGGAGKRDNGIPYASFGLVWKEFGEQLCGGKSVADEIDKHLVQPVDSVDNGIKVAKPIYEDISPYTISDYLMSYRTVGTHTDEELYQTFIEIVEIAKALLKREIANEKVSEQLRNETRDAYEQAGGKKEVIVLLKPNNRHIWRPVISKYSEPLYVVYQGLDSEGKGWKVEAVSISPDTYDLRKPFPTAWGGKEGAELAELSTVKDSIFCHRGLFTASAHSKEGAMKLAELALIA